MKEETIPLTMFSAGKTVKLAAITGGGGLRRRLNDMGLKEGDTFKILHSHRYGPCIISFGGTRLVLGRGMAEKILVREA